ncbi:MAG: YicC family protein [Sphingobacteriaceae bacterium]|nr:YicC family protein [Cytophagaceae bacterium]
MLQSMTGFGRATAEAGNYTATAELKTLNSKSSDIFCRLPRSLSAREIELRNLLSAELERGKIELYLSTQRGGEAQASLTVNRPLVAAYVRDLRETAQEVGAYDSTCDVHLLKIALTLPNATTSDAQPEGEADDEWQAALQAVKSAIAECKTFRQREGAVVETEFRRAIDSIEIRLRGTEAHDVYRIPAVRERLRRSITDLVESDSFDPNRFEQELVYYVEKYDISEEKVRLQTHLTYFREVLNGEGNGKKLAFIGQEIGREINTIGSKANDAHIQRLVVEMKDELEKIKEQTANVL